MGLRPAPRQVRKQCSSSRMRVQAAPRTGTSADTCSLGPPRPSLARLPPLRLGRGPALLSSHAGPRGLGEESGALEALRQAFPRQLRSAHPMRVTVNQRQASGPRARNGGCIEGPGSGRPRNRAAACSERAGIAAGGVQADRRWYPDPQGLSLFSQAFLEAVLSSPRSRTRPLSPKQQG